MAMTNHMKLEQPKPKAMKGEGSYNMPKNNDHDIPNSEYIMKHLQINQHHE